MKLRANRHTRFLIAVLFHWLAATPALVPSINAQTQTTGSLSGRVYDAGSPAKEGVADVRMVLVNQETGVRRALLTGDNGEYSFDLLMPSWYELSCQADGYENLSGSQRNLQVFIATRRELKVPPFELRKIPTGRARLFPPPVAEVEKGLGRASLLASRSRNTTTPTRLAGRLALPFHSESMISYGFRMTLGHGTLAGPSNLTRYHTGPPVDAPDQLAGGQASQTPAGTPPSSAPTSAGLRQARSLKLVDALSATRGGVFTEIELQSLPLQGIRTFDALALLLPGVVGPPQTISSTPGPGIGASVGTAGQFSVNGLRSRGNNFTIDGSDNNDEDIGVRRQGFTSLVPQSIESVNQFQVATLLPEPQYGRNLGAQANAVSSSGAKDIHGKLYGFFTDSRLNARDFFDLDRTGLPEAFPVLRFGTNGPPALLDSRELTQPNPLGHENPFTRSQAGFAIGGPVKPGRTYFFVTMEHQDLNASRESHFAVPTVPQRGLFGNGAEGLLFPGLLREIGVYPTSVFGDAVFSLFPWPNDPLGPYGVNTRTEILPADADGLVMAGKIDQHIRLFDKDNTLTSRFSLSDDDTVLPVTGAALLSTVRSSVRTQNISVFLNSSLSNQSSNQLRFSYGRTTLHFDEYSPIGTGQRDSVFSNPGDARFLLNAPIMYNLTNGRFPAQTTYRSYRSLSQAGSQNLPSVDGTEAITGPIGQLVVSGFSPLGIDVFNFPQDRTNNTFQFAETLILNSSGRHRITAGIDFRRSQLNSLVERNSRSQMVFSAAPNLNLFEGNPVPILAGGKTTQAFYLGTDFAAVGDPTGFFQSLAAPASFGTIGLRYWQSDFFISDQYRPSSKVAITIGLRYSFNTVPTEVKNRIEDTFSSSEMKTFQQREKQESAAIGKPPISGLEVFLDGRQKIFRKDGNNVAPYFAFAWSPAGQTTSVRSGIGVYYDQIPGAVISQSRNVFPSFLTVNLGGYRRDPSEPASSFFLGASNPSCSTEDRAQQPSLCYTLPGTIDQFDISRNPGITDFMIDTARRTNLASGPAFVLPSNHLATPLALHWDLAIEQELLGNFLLSIAYVGTKGKSLLRFATPNLGPNSIPIVLRGVPLSDGSPRFRGTTSPPGTAITSGLQTTNGRGFPFLGSYTSIESDAHSLYHSLQLSLNRRLDESFHVSGAYTWSHSIDEVSDLFDLGGNRSLPQNSFALAADRGSSSFDVRHRFVSSFVYELPVPWKNRLVTGWKVAGILTAQTGTPFSILAPYDANLDGNLTDRLSSTTGVSLTSHGPQQFVVSDISPLIPALGTDGKVGRNTFRSPGLLSFDLAIDKRFLLSERHALQFRCEFFNLFNRTHFGIPVHLAGFPAFGWSTNTIVPARVVQLALKYSF